MPTDIADPPINVKKDEGLWATLAKAHAANSGLKSHQHRAGQLVFATSGVMLVETPGARWTVPPQRALWIPPQHMHAIQFISPTALRTVYCQPDLLSQCSGLSRQNEVHAVVASPLIKALVLGLFDTQFDHATRLLMVRLLLQTLHQTDDLPTRLPMPHSTALKGAVAPLLQANHWQLPMHQLAGDAAMSERTFSRRFQAEVGLNFRVWRQRARILASLDLLASDAPVKSIAHTLQFETAAAYVAAFRAVLGCTPHAFRSSNRTG
jgi:AraC-like DNA-binding protein